MALEVHWSREALSDLEQIRAYISLDSEDRADRFIDLLIEKGNELGEFPYSGHSVDDLPHLPLRMISVKGYRILHHVDETRIGIDGVIHGARDLRSLWEREGRSLD